jgi:predicted AlkP superfamily phosphohydrolase/phosphomutase
MRRTLLLGVDGATFSVLDALMADGTMPFLRELVDGGTRANLMSTVNPLTAQAWPALMTGRTPGNHGLLDFVQFQPRPGGGHFRFTTSRDLACETIWARAGRQGRTVTALNFFGLYPPVPVNGHTIAAFVPWRHLKDAVHPPELYARLQSLPGFDRRELAMDLDLEKKCLAGLAEGELTDWIELHLRRDRQWLDIATYLLENDPSDIFAIVFDGADKLQHACWPFIDPELARAATSPAERATRELCLAYFRQIDGILARLVELSGPDTRTLVVSDHGFGPTTEVFYVNTWLEQQGLLRWADRATPDTDGRLAEDRVKSQVMMIDWEHTDAYAVSPSSNGIFLAPGREHLRDELAAALLAASDPDGGPPIVTSVRTREDAYPGPCGDRAPHLLLTLRDGGFISVLRSEGPLKRREQPAGTHRPAGVFIAAGPGVRRGVSVPALSILDVAPLIMHSAGLPVPSDLEGRVPVEVLEPQALAAEPVEIEDEVLAVPVGAVSGSTDMPGREIIEERLRALGYFE